MISRRTLVLALLFAPAATATSFDDRFNGDRSPALEPCETRNACQVKQAPEVTLKSRPKKEKKRRHRRTRHGDICRGRGRTYTKNGKSWRCNRS